MGLLANKVESLHEYVTNQNKVITHNAELFDIFEGDLLKFLLDELANQISIEAFNMAEKRIPPINILIN